MSWVYSLSDELETYFGLVQCSVKNELIWVVPRAERQLLVTRVIDRPFYGTGTAPTGEISGSVCVINTVVYGDPGKAWKPKMTPSLNNL